MRGDQIVIIGIDREVVKTLTERARQIELRDFLQSWRVGLSMELRRERTNYQDYRSE